MTQTAVHTGTGSSAFGGIASFFRSIGNAMVRMAEANGRLRQVQYLNNLSDRQLAELGIERTEIVRHVFRDTFYT